MWRTLGLASAFFPGLFALCTRALRWAAPAWSARGGGVPGVGGSPLLAGPGVAGEGQPRRTRSRNPGSAAGGARGAAPGSSGAHGSRPVRSPEQSHAG
uniref:Secreted protein n=1 Tax=Anas platyrhynchos TaxID=8839 RepID=A0A8B9TSC6_ANAPL